MLYRWIKGYNFAIHFSCIMQVIINDTCKELEDTALTLHLKIASENLIF